MSQNAWKKSFFLSVWLHSHERVWLVWFIEIAKFMDLLIYKMEAINIRWKGPHGPLNPVSCFIGRLYHITPFINLSRYIIKLGSQYINTSPSLLKCLSSYILGSYLPFSQPHYVDGSWSFCNLLISAPLILIELFAEILAIHP